MDTNDFSTAKVGDRVWDFLNGWGEVVESDTSDGTIRVGFNSSRSYWYKNNGSLYEQTTKPSLFWDEVVITPPPRPKRKVTKVIEGWVNVYPGGPSSSIHQEKRKADLHNNTRIACVRVTGEYTVEE